MLPLRRQPEIWVALGISATVAVTYLLYTPFREWWYLRFLLPALPMLTVLAVSALFVGVRRWWIVVPAAVAVVAWTTTSLEMRQALDLARIERRFRTTGDLVRQRLPMNAVFITVFESGTVRYHAGAPAILWDSLDPAWLDRGLQWLTTRGFEPFIILEQWEEPAFRERFAARSPIGQLDWPPRFEIEHQVRIFRPADRSRYLAGEQISHRVRLARSPIIGPNMRGSLAIAVLLWLVANQPGRPPGVEWPVYGGDQGATRHSPLTDINRSNVSGLTSPGRWRPNETALKEYGTEPGTFQNTPLMIGDVLYLSTPYNRVVALNARTGVELWRYDPEPFKDGQPPNGTGFVHRGVAAWRDESGALRIFMNSRYRLICLDAQERHTRQDVRPRRYRRS